MSAPYLFNAGLEDLRLAFADARTGVRGPISTGEPVGTTDNLERGFLIGRRGRLRWNQSSKLLDTLFTRC